MEKTPRHHFFHDDGRMCEKKEEKKSKIPREREWAIIELRCYWSTTIGCGCLPKKNKQLSPSHGPNVAQLFGLAFFFFFFF